MLKTQLYEKQVAELKKLYERISKATDPKVKTQLALLAKKLDESLKGLTKEIHELYEQLQKENKKSGRGKESLSDAEDGGLLSDGSCEEEDVNVIPIPNELVV